MFDLSSLRPKIDQAGDALRREAFEGARVAEEQERATLSLARRLIAVVRVVLDEKKSASPNDGWPVIVMSLLVKAIATVRAAVTVGAAGHARETGVLVRSALESLINAAFIGKDDSELRAKRWAECAFIFKAKLLKKQPHLSKTAEHVKAREQIMAQAKSLEEHFPSASFWASGLSKGSLRDLAGDVGPCSAVCSSLRSPLGASVTHPLREFDAQPGAISNVEVWYVFCVFSVVFRHQESSGNHCPQRSQGMLR